jgi:hypothetical protein
LILDDLANVVAVSPARQTLSEDQRKAALDDLLRHAVAVSGGNSHSGANEQIDADLSREFRAGRLRATASILKSPLPNLFPVPLLIHRLFILWLIKFYQEKKDENPFG